MSLAMMLAPGAIGILTYGDSLYYPRLEEVMPLITSTRYKNNNVDEPAFQIGIALPPLN